MNIRPSLKRYFLVSVLVTGIVTIAAMTYVSYHFYFLGVDFSTSDFARANAYRVAVSDGKPGRLAASPLQRAGKTCQQPYEATSMKATSLKTGCSSSWTAIRSCRLPRPATLRSSSTGWRTALCFVHVRGRARRPEEPKEPPQFFHIFAIALGAIFLFSLVPVLLLRKLPRPWNT